MQKIYLYAVKQLQLSALGFPRTTNIAGKGIVLQKERVTGSSVSPRTAVAAAVAIISSGQGFRRSCVW